MKNPAPWIAYSGCLLLVLTLSGGCGTTKSQTATEQLLLSSAVDQAVADVDFRDLTGKTVYFDTQFIKNAKGPSFVNADYIISSLRQQLFAANCQLQDKMEDADYVVEARVGALGIDSHDVVYGIPASNALGTATTLMPNTPNVPVIPEIAVMKRNDQLGAAKLAVFAYHRESKQAVWQSGISKAKATSKDLWVLGAGPFERGTLWDGTHFAGSKLEVPLKKRAGDDEDPKPIVNYNQEVHFLNPARYESQSSVENISFDAPPGVEIDVSELEPH